MRKTKRVTVNHIGCLQRQHSVFYDRQNHFHAYDVSNSQASQPRSLRIFSIIMCFLLSRPTPCQYTDDTSKLILLRFFFFFNFCARQNAVIRLLTALRILSFLWTPSQQQRLYSRAPISSTCRHPGTLAQGGGGGVCKFTFAIPYVVCRLDYVVSSHTFLYHVGKARAFLSRQCLL